MGLDDIKMKVEQRQQDELTIFDFEGDFDSRSAGSAKDQMREAIAEGHNRILVNLDGVNYIDSAGLGTLVSALKTVREQNGNIWLAGLTSHVRMVMELTRLHRVFEIFEDVEEALSRLTEAGAGETS